MRLAAAVVNCFNNYFFKFATKIDEIVYVKASKHTALRPLSPHNYESP